MTRRSWIWTAVLAVLCLSLAANFFSVGYAVHGYREAVTASGAIDTIASAYPPETRQEFRHVLRENRARTLAALRDLRAARAKLSNASNASPFEEEVVRNAMQDVSKATTALQETMQDYLLTALKRIKEKPGGTGAQAQ